METKDALATAYQRDGFVICEGLISPREVAELKQEAVDISRGKYACPELKPLPADMPDDEVLRSILCIHQVHYVSPLMLTYVKHPKIAEVLTHVIGPNVKCMQSMLFVKPPEFQGQAWHQDEVYIPTRDRSLCGGWVALDDATVENGCLWVIPGSHATGYMYPQRAHSNPEEFDFAPESYGFDDAQEIPVELEAGSMVFFNGYLLHRSKRNRSTVYRRALVNHYMNAYSLLPWGVKPGETPANADRRCIVTVAGEDPYAWKGYEDPPQSVHLRKCKANEAVLKE